MSTNVLEFNETLYDDEGNLCFLGVDQDVGALIIKLAFPHLCQRFGMPIDGDSQRNLPQLEWAITSPFSSRKQFTLKSDHVWLPSTAVLLHRTKLGITTPLNTLSEGSKPVVHVYRDLSWIDGPYTAKDGQTFKVTGQGFASLYQWVRRINFTTNDAKLIHMFCRSPAQLKRENSVPHLNA